MPDPVSEREPDDLDQFMLDEIARDPDMAARFKVAEYRQRAEAAEAEVVRLREALSALYRHHQIYCRSFHCEDALAARAALGSREGAE